MCALCVGRGDDCLLQTRGRTVSSADVLQVVLLLRLIWTSDGDRLSLITLDFGGAVTAGVCQRVLEAQ